MGKLALCLGLGLGLAGPAWAPTAVEGNLLPAVQHGLLLPALKGAIKGLPAVQHRTLEKGTIGGQGGAQEVWRGSPTNGASQPKMGDGSVRPGSVTDPGAGASPPTGGGGTGLPAVQAPVGC